MLLNLGDLDLVVVAAPTPLHADLVERTLWAGIATVVDKPLAVHSADAERLIELARERDVPLTVFQNRRWDGDFLTVRRLIEDRRLGQFGGRVAFRMAEQSPAAGLEERHVRPGRRWCRL